MKDSKNDEIIKVISPWLDHYHAGPPLRYITSESYSKYITRENPIALEKEINEFTTNNNINRYDAARFYSFCLLSDQLTKENLPGDIAELGVYKGNTAVLLANTARRLGKTAYLLDTYEGFSSKDLKGIDSDKAMQFDDVTFESVKELVGDKNTRFIKGYFPESASQIPPDTKFCLVHIDCDLYDPIRAGLEYFYPRVVEGGFIVIHDYSSFYWEGAEKAIDEFFADKPESVIPMPDLSGSVIIRKMKSTSRHENWFFRKNILPQNQWIFAKNNYLNPYLESGWCAHAEKWSDVENDWGVWGLGSQHSLRLYLPLTKTDIYIDFDVHTVLEGTRKKQNIDVFVSGQKNTSWTFTPENNRAIRTIFISNKTAKKAIVSHALPYIVIEFRPHSVSAISAFNPNSSDNRLLGLGLRAIRCRDRKNSTSRRLLRRIWNLGVSVF